MIKKGVSMVEKDKINSDSMENTRRHMERNRFIRVFFARKEVIFGAIIILIFLILAIFAPLIAPYSPYSQDLERTLLQPSWEHLLGTDALGRDTLSRIIYGAQTSLLIGIVVIALASLSGMTLGLVAGYFGGWINLIIMRLIDALMSFPMIILALIIAVLLGGGLTIVMIALGIGLLPVYARLMCAQVLVAKQQDYVIAGRVIGANPLRIMLLHILPNSFAQILVLMTMMMGMAILAEAGLSFLGLGIAPPGAAWGAMVADGYRYVFTHPVLCFAPGLAIMLVVFSFNMVGDGLRDALDPRLRGIV